MALKPFSRVQNSDIILLVDVIKLFSMGDEERAPSSTRAQHLQGNQELPGRQTLEDSYFISGHLST